MSVVYRQAVSEDIGAIYKVETVCFKQSWTLESIYTDILENDLSHYIVAEADSVIAGYCGVHIIFDEGHITNVAVLPEYRKRGIGRELLETMMAQTGLDYYTLEVRESNNAAIQLYTGMGFRTFGKRPKYYGDEDALIMWKGKTTP